MSAREEKGHVYEAIIKALMKALTDIKGLPTDSLKPPTFDWNSSEQFEDFWLFIKGMESCTHSKAYLTRMVISHDWSICSISWIPSDEGSTSSGTPLVQLQRNERRIRRMLSSLWSFYTAPWITLSLNDARYTNWKRSGLRLARHQTNLFNKSED